MYNKELTIYLYCYLCFKIFCLYCWCTTDWLTIRSQGSVMESRRLKHFETVEVLLKCCHTKESKGRRGLDGKENWDILEVYTGLERKGIWRIRCHMISRVVIYTGQSPTRDITRSYRSKLWNDYRVALLLAKLCIFSAELSQIYYSYKILFIKISIPFSQNFRNIRCRV